MNQDSRIYSVPVKTAAFLFSGVLFAIGTGCFEAFVWLVEEGVFEMNAFDISRYLSVTAMYSGEGDYLTFIRLLVKGRYVIVALGLFMTLCYLLLVTFLFTIAGHRKGVEGIKRSPFDELPFEIISVLYLASFSLAFSLGADVGGKSMIVGGIVSVTFYSVAYYILLGFLLSLVVNVKAGTFFSGMLLVRGIKFVGELISASFEKDSSILRVGVYFCIVLLFEGLAFFTELITSNILVAFFLTNFLVFLLILYVVKGIERLEAGGKRMAGGDVDYRIDERGLIWDFKSMAKHFNQIGEGLEGALNERMKSERFKTELITNVSHDIKTPLTSIINYTDLLKKEKIENEQIKTYLEVLERQSARLKRLITDLIEASKASSGSLKVEFMEFDIGVMLSQVMGEYQDKLEKAGLTVVTKIGEGSYLIRADGRHLFRVLDNILNNICKYAKIDTRVYVELEKREGKTIATFKNISHAELNIPGEELMERFVRGERARNTEGSGLGLSIAKSMMELMEAELKIHVDGDLFKVELIF